MINFANLFYYQFIFITIHGSLHFLVLFMSPTVLFQLTFIFIYSIFNKIFSVSAKQTDLKQTFIQQNN